MESITHQEPGLSLLSEKNQKNYHKEIQGYLKGKMKNGKTYNRKQMKVLLVKFFLKLTNPNSEFDILLFLKVNTKIVSKSQTKPYFFLPLIYYLI